MNLGRHVIAGLLLSACWASGQPSAPEWQQALRERVKGQQWDAALLIVERRLAAAPGDLEARGWRGRLLAWKGRWSDAEAEYRRVLERAPDDSDILTGLADVLVWQQRPADALPVLDRARRASPGRSEILVRRAKVLRVLGRTGEARADFRQALVLDPNDHDAKAGLAGLGEETKHEIRVGLDADTFNYTDPAQVQAVSLSSRWTPRWSTLFSANFVERFGEEAQKLSASTACRLGSRDWLSVGGAAGHDRAIVPRSEAFFEYGHGFRFGNRYVRGLETAYQQRWLWYRNAQILTLTASQVVYLPGEWTWSLAVTGARSRFPDTGSEWRPSGVTRVVFPLHRRLTGNLSFGVGSENFAQVDQIGRFAARTFGGGLRYQLAPNQDISGYVAVQDRSQSRSQNSFGMSYGFRF